MLLAAKEPHQLPRDPIVIRLHMLRAMRLGNHLRRHVGVLHANQIVQQLCRKLGVALKGDDVCPGVSGSDALLSLSLCVCVYISLYISISLPLLPHTLILEESLTGARAVAPHRHCASWQHGHMVAVRVTQREDRLVGGKERTSGRRELKRKDAELGGGQLRGDGNDSQ